MSARTRAGRGVARLLFRMAGALVALVVRAAARAFVPRVRCARARRRNAARDASARWVYRARATRIRRLLAAMGREAALLEFLKTVAHQETGAEIPNGALLSRHKQVLNRQDRTYTAGVGKRRRTQKSAPGETQRKRCRRAMYPVAPRTLDAARPIAAEVL